MTERAGLLVCLIQELWPVLDGSGHVADVDEVKRMTVIPVLLDVVDEEFDVWRGARRTKSTVRLCNPFPLLSGSWLEVH